MILKAKWGNWYFEKFSCKNGFFLFFSIKNWEIVQFHLGQIFCSVCFRSYRPLPRESTGRELSNSFSACGGAHPRLDSVLRPKNTENSTKNGQNQKHQENCPISPWTKFPHCG
jgi:hypothetical protein